MTHRFVYPACYFALDLAELAEHHRLLPLFGYNCLRAVSVYDRDYLGPGEGTMTAKWRDLLLTHGIAEGAERTVLLTCPRHLGVGFNPISLFLAYREDGALHCVVAEVRNTYGEAHLYVLREPLQPSPGFDVRYRVPKAFFVSPFNDMKGEYEFQIAALDGHLHVRIDLLRDGKPALLTELRGQGLMLNSWNLARALLRCPGNAALAAPRIAWQAARLQRRGLRPRMKPKPCHPMTVRIGKPLLTGRLWRG